MILQRSLIQNSWTSEKKPGDGGDVNGKKHEVWADRNQRAKESFMEARLDKSERAKRRTEMVERYNVQECGKEEVCSSNEDSRIGYDVNVAFL